jgi:hypothetical protein
MALFSRRLADWQIWARKPLKSKAKAIYGARFNP